MSIKNSHKLKQSISEKTVVELELKKIDKEINEYTESKLELIAKHKGILKKINGLQKDIVVSEHAILRYFERILGYDLEDIKAKILTEDVIKAHTIFKNGTFPMDKGKATIKNNVVITIKI